MNPPFQAAESTRDALLSSGANALQAGDPATALGLFTQAAEAAPVSTHVLTGLGMSRYMLGQHQAALDEFLTAVQRDPASVDARCFLALTLARLGRLPEAQREIGNLAGMLGGADFLIGTFFARILELRDAEAVLAVSRAWQNAFPAAVAPLAVRAPALQELERADDYRQLMAFEHLMKVVRNFHTTVAFGGALPLNQALCESILSAAKVDIVKDRKATKLGEQTVHLDPKASPALRAFFSTLAQTVHAHVQRVTAGAPDHEWVRMKPATFRVAAWGVSLGAGGHQNPHIHPAAWLSGVYYPRVPPGAIGAQPPAGWLEIGRASAYITRPPSLEVQMVPPAEGTLVLFPSYYWHATGPAAAPGRMSLAFDIVGGSRGHPLE